MIAIIDSVVLIIYDYYTNLHSCNCKKQLNIEENTDCMSAAICVHFKICTQRPAKKGPEIISLPCLHIVLSFFLFPAADHHSLSGDVYFVRMVISVKIFSSDGLRPLLRSPASTMTER